MEKQSKIVTEKLCFSYKGRSVLENIDLSLPENSVIAVTGPSGTGKSTFLSIFNRLWEEGDFQGKVMIRFNDGIKDIYNSTLSIDELRRRVGMVFQAPNPLPMTILKNITFPLQLTRKISKEHAAAKVEEMLIKVHLFHEVKDRLNHDARTLSGGQQQRLCIARALMLNPEILLLDEPTSSLDIKSCAKIEDLLVELKSNHTLLVVSHYQDQIKRIGDQTYEMNEKQLKRIL
ncbi:MAG: ATP-binding cassette domain-containing protein [Desulforhopalus sp.]|nr:ATP-binding cassette domain-containing protein [Desulforhopalus sp.]